MLSVNVLADCMCMRIELTVRRKPTYAVVRPLSSLESQSRFQGIWLVEKRLWFSPQQPSTTMLGILPETHKTQSLAPTPDENWYSMFRIPVSKLLLFCKERESSHFELHLYCEFLAHYSLNWYYNI